MGNLYLVAYNAALFAGWAYVLYLTWRTVLVEHGSSADVYKVVELPLKVSQTAAIMEVVHSALGVVRSPVAITAMQVASRLWVLWGLIVPVPAATTQGALVLGQVAGVTLKLDLVSLLTAWCLSEIIRYSFFALKELGTVPYPFLWLRYTAFIVLYPIGVASELTMAFLAMPVIKAKNLWSYHMPNQLNFSFDYYTVCLLVCLTYAPGLPQLYLYMLKQRSKMLGGGGAKAVAGKVKAQ